MSIYRLWLLSLDEKSVIYTKYFPHLEKKDGFVFPWISSREFIKCLYITLGIESSENGIFTNTKESNMSIFQYDNEYVSLKYGDDSSSSSSSLKSMTSFISNSTMNTSSISKQISLDSSLLSESNILKEYICLYSHLPLLICPLINLRKPDENLFSNEDYKKTGIDNLIMLVYEQNGYLFICCPRITSKRKEDIMTKDCLENEKLFVEEHNISLAYTILHMIASMFFKKNKSIQSIEWFISSYMPFGNLLKTRSKEDLLILSSLYPKEIVMSICLTESISTSFQTCWPNIVQGDQYNETIFGTMTINFINSKFKLSKAEIIMNIDNLNSVSLVLPTNCISKDLTLVYDVNHRNQYNLNVVHYKSYNKNEDTKNYSVYSDNQQSGANILKLFRIKYKIYKKVNSTPEKKSFIDIHKLHHISLRFILNDKIPFEEIKFKYFLVKFSLNRGISNKKVQTMDNSINNLIIRDSVQITQGQLKSENNMLVWMIGSKLSKSKKVSIDFDLVINKDNLVNLDTQCNFSHNFQFKSLMTLKQLIKQQYTRIMSHNEERYKLKESKIIYPINMIVPYLKCSKISLILEPQEIIKSEEERSSINHDEYLHIEYHLNSFEYKLFPKILDDNSI